MSKTQEIFTRVTEKVIANLETAGSWRHFWQYSIPMNLDGHRYNGVNLLLLAVSDYDLPIWGTFNQIRRNGGRVRKGEKSTIIVFWDQFTPEEVKKEDEKPRWFLRYYSVFNVAQAEFDDMGQAKIKELSKNVGNVSNSYNQTIDKFLSDMPDRPRILHDKNISNPYYMVGSDAVKIFPVTSYTASHHYYHDLFHEIVHSTGHPRRLNRFDIESLRENLKENYSKEELVAELEASFLSEIFQLPIDISNSAAYIKGWASKLRENTQWITWAASRAEKAVRYIMGEQITSGTERRVA